LFKKEIAKLEAGVFNNIAFCFGKLKDSAKEIEYCSKIIDRAMFLDDITTLTKTYLRRGLAYEL
jgi:hypothetical protein